MSLIEDNISLNDDTFPHRLASLIKGLDLSQAEICKKTGISKQALHHYLSGTRIPRADTLLTLSKLLNVSMEYLLTGESDQNKIDTKGLTDVQIQRVNEYASLFRILNSVEKELPISFRDLSHVLFSFLSFNKENNGIVYNDLYRNIENTNYLDKTLFLTTRLNKSETGKIFLCPNCKHMVFSSFTFCPYCGKKIVA